MSDVFQTESDQGLYHSEVVGELIDQVEYSIDRQCNVVANCGV